MSEDAPMKLRHTIHDLSIARVLFEDDAFITLEVAKDENRKLRIEEGDQFLTIMFVRQVDGRTETWQPWATPS